MTPLPKRFKVLDRVETSDEAVERAKYIYAQMTGEKLGGDVVREMVTAIFSTSTIGEPAPVTFHYTEGPFSAWKR